MSHPIKSEKSSPSLPRVRPGETAEQFFKRRANGKTGSGLGRILDRAPDRAPEPGDELPDGWDPSRLGEKA